MLVLKRSLVFTVLLDAIAAAAAPGVRRDEATAISSISGSEATPTSSPGGAYQVCHNPSGQFAPFCSPANGSSVFVDSTYYVTWDSSYFKSNETLLVQANYVNPAGAGPQAFQSDPTSNSWAHIALTVQRDWLKNMASNNVTLFISTSSGKTVGGPVVMVTTSPIAYASMAPTPAPQGATLYIALPVTFGFIALCICGGFFLNRKHRRIGLGNIMGRRKGYGAGQSRRQRLGLGRKDYAAEAIALEPADEPADQRVYRDFPAGRGVAPGGPAAMA